MWKFRHYKVISKLRFIGQRKKNHIRKSQLFPASYVHTKVCFIKMVTHLLLYTVANETDFNLISNLFTTLWLAATTIANAKEQDYLMDA